LNYSNPNYPPRATSENCAATRPTGSSFVDFGNSFNMLDKTDDVDNEGYVPDYLNQDRIKGRFQQRCELMLKRREMAGIYHTSHRHCNNCQTVLNLQAKGIQCNHLKRYILHQTLYILEFERSSDRNKDFLRLKKDEANEQHSSIIEALRADAPEWTFEPITGSILWQGVVVQ